ncbi:MAG: PKD domain-containing protein, partial [Bacteroidota bacterium]
TKRTYMSNIRLLLGILLSLPYSMLAQTQDLGGVINRYANVLSIESCSATLELSSTIGFSESEDVLLIQMRGAQINESNNNSFGSVIDLQHTGQFERATIASIDGNTIQLTHELVNAYDPGSGLQIVNIPSYENADVNTLLSAAPWDGQTGGILALEVSNQLTLNADIDVSGLGFRGGQVQRRESDCSWVNAQSDFYYNGQDWKGAAKGESILNTPTDKSNGKGAWASAGGGGNDHNSGGGGGANVARGGNGGRYNSASLLGCRGQHPGIGGYALTASDLRMHLGGGGGSGHADDANGGSDGGHGGGVVFLFVDQLISNDHRIIATGADAIDASGEGGGGGGGGGAIWLQLNQVEGPLQASVAGGKGANTGASSSRCFGPGGGGGGGQLYLNKNFNTQTLTTDGGAAGTVSGDLSECDGETNGATAGMDGQFDLLSTAIARGDIAVSPPALVSPLQAPIACVGTTLQLVADVSGSGLQLQWQIDRGIGFTDLENNNTFTGVQTEVLNITEVEAALAESRFRIVLSNECYDPVISNSVAIEVEAPPTANFNFAETEDGLGLTNFSSNYDSLYWDFGDGNSSNEINPIHQFAEGNEYLITLSVFNSCGSDSLQLVYSTTSAPVARIDSGNPRSCAPHRVQFDALGSTDASSFEWQFPGGTPASSTEPNPEVLYEASGNFDVLLIVQNEAGTDTLLLGDYVQLLDFPVVDFDYFVSGTSVRFEQFTATDLECIWDFDDGSPLSSELNPRHSYDDYGLYNVQLLCRNAFCSSVVASEVSLVRPLSTHELSKLHGLQLFPNPTEGPFYMTWHSEALRQIELFSVSGQQLYQLPASSRKEISWDLSHLPKGVYFLKMKSDKYIWTERLVIH